MRELFAKLLERERFREVLRCSDQIKTIRVLEYLRVGCVETPPGLACRERAKPKATRPLMLDQSADTKRRGHTTRSRLFPSAPSFRSFNIVVIGLLVSGSGFSTRAQTTTVEVENRILLTPDKTPAQARTEAINGALGEAVRQAVGTQIQAEQSLFRSETPGGLQDRFLSVVQLATAGRAIDWRFIEDRMVGVGTQTYYLVKLAVTVEAETGRPDPGFQVSLRLNDELFFDRGSPQESDEIVATITTTQDAYLTIFGVSDDTVQVLLPNPLVPQNFIPQGTEFEFPSAEWRARGLRLRAVLPPGRSKTEEYMVVVGTRTEVPFGEASGRIEGQIVETVKAMLMDLNRWLVNIPLDQRAIAFAGYEVRKQ